MGKLKDIFYRVEFQQRGSPHIHGLLWVEDVPHYNVDNDWSIEAFVDQYITTDRHPDRSHADDLVQLQMHRHSHTCKKNTKTLCRFNFPLPPMRSTQLLEPLPCLTLADKKKHSANWTNVISRYTERPKCLSHMCLADFATLRCKKI